MEKRERHHSQRTSNFSLTQGQKFTRTSIHKTLRQALNPLFSFFDALERSLPSTRMMIAVEHRTKIPVKDCISDFRAGRIFGYCYE